MKKCQTLYIRLCITAADRTSKLFSTFVNFYHQTPLSHKVSTKCFTLNHCYQQSDRFPVSGTNQDSECRNFVQNNPLKF